MDQRFLSDCYFYKEDHDMGATIPYCSYESSASYECPCAIGCEHYISTQEVERLVRKQMLSAEPERKTGKWIYLGDGYMCPWSCSDCGSCNNERTCYCPDCGAKMGGEQDDN